MIILRWIASFIIGSYLAGYEPDKPEEIAKEWLLMARDAPTRVTHYSAAQRLSAIAAFDRSQLRHVEPHGREQEDGAVTLWASTIDSHHVNHDSLVYDGKNLSDSWSDIPSEPSLDYDSPVITGYQSYVIPDYDSSTRRPERLTRNVLPAELQGNQDDLIKEMRNRRKAIDPEENG